VTSSPAVGSTPGPVTRRTNQLVTLQVLFAMVQSSSAEVGCLGWAPRTTRRTRPWVLLGSGGCAYVGQLTGLTVGLSGPQARSGSRGVAPCSRIPSRGWLWQEAHERGWPSGTTDPCPISWSTASGHGVTGGCGRDPRISVATEGASRARRPPARVAQATHRGCQRRHRRCRRLRRPHRTVHSSASRPNRHDWQTPPGSTDLPTTTPSQNGRLSRFSKILSHQA
jgi:hypothetical protein